MKKPVAIFTIFFALAVISFGTWQLFMGNLEAAFSSFPFLLIIYVFVLRAGNNAAGGPGKPAD
jgi:membrane protein implicated in regulation of membrane protease activity